MSVTIWTPAEDEQVRALWTAGLSASGIGRRIGKTKNSVIGRVHRLAGTEKRKAPNMEHELTDAELKLIRTMLENRCTNKFIMKRVHVSEERVRTFRLQWNFPNTHRWQVQRRDLRTLPVCQPEVSSVSRLPLPPKPTALDLFNWVPAGNVVQFKPAKPRQCEYLEGETPRTFVRCEAMSIGAGRPYCAEHHALCYQPPRSAVA